MDQEIITMISWGGLTPREIGQVLGISASVVRVRAHRARAKLRSLLSTNDAKLAPDQNSAIGRPESDRSTDTGAQRLSHGRSAACYAGAFAEVRIGKANLFEVDSDVFHLTAAGHRRIALTFSKKQLRRLEAALRKHRKITASITGEPTNAAGTADNAETPAKSLRIKQ